MDPEGEGAVSTREWEWHKGAPENLEPGMAVRWRRGGRDGMSLVGSDSSTDPDGVFAWTWVVTPYAAAWQADMAKAKDKHGDCHG